MPTFGSLFAGIGGIDLGLERAGWECRFQVEWDEFCQRVLAKHWPDVPRFGDIHDVHGAAVCPHADSEGQSDGPDDAAREQPLRLGCSHCLPPVDLLAGGFPCQPFSVAGKQRRLEDDRWLWPEFARAIRELRPRYVLIENVPGLLANGRGWEFDYLMPPSDGFPMGDATDDLGGGMGAVLGDLATLGYDAEWDSIPAAAVGAPHLRYRVWIVAYATDERRERNRGTWNGRPRLADGSVAVPPHAGSQRSQAGLVGQVEGEEGRPGVTLDGDPSRRREDDRIRPDEWWAVEPDVGRVAHGVPARVDRLRGLGNAVVPQVVEVIGRAMIEDYFGPSFPR